MEHFYKLKKDAVPRFFDCQMDRKRAASKFQVFVRSPRRAYKKLKTMRLLNEMLADKENIDSCLQKNKIYFYFIIEYKSLGKI